MRHVTCATKNSAQVFGVLGFFKCEIKKRVISSGSELSRGSQPTTSALFKPLTSKRQVLLWKWQRVTCDGARWSVIAIHLAQTRVDLLGKEAVGFGDVDAHWNKESACEGGIVRKNVTKKG